jgi:N6-L-threonylcarbamoyladenine synthase
MVGLRAGEAVAFSLGIPFLGIHHHEAHLYSAWIAPAPAYARFDAFEPNISLIVSGGHTILVHVTALWQHAVVGSTLDDAAGECFDKAGKQIGLPYPAGPIIDKLASHGNPAAFAFTRPKMDDPDDDFSFSGLKTSVRYYLRDHPEVLSDRLRLPDVCASLQQAIVEVLVKKTIRAALRVGVRCVTASGGVTCNSALRKELALACASHGLKLRLASNEFCADNAAMIGILAEQKLKSGAPSTPLDADIRPNWPLAQSATA